MYVGAYAHGCVSLCNCIYGSTSRGAASAWSAPRSDTPHPAPSYVSCPARKPPFPTQMKPAGGSESRQAPFAPHAKEAGCGGTPARSTRPGSAACAAVACGLCLLRLCGIEPLVICVKVWSHARRHAPRQKLNRLRRHSNSIDPAKHRCGVCRGRLQCLGSFNPDGTPLAKRAASPYSLFVKVRPNRPTLLVQPYVPLDSLNLPNPATAARPRPSAPPRRDTCCS